MYKNIMTEQRAEPEYFRVGFYGKGFPTFLQVSEPNEITLDCKENLNNLLFSRIFRPIILTFIADNRTNVWVILIHEWRPNFLGPPY